MDLIRSLFSAEVAEVVLSPQQFGLNLLLAVVLSALAARLYERYGRGLSNRRRRRVT